MTAFIVTLGCSSGLAVDRSGRIYIAEWDANNVKMWDGNTLLTLADESAGVWGPNGLAVDPSGRQEHGGCGLHACPWYCYNQQVSGQGHSAITPISRLHVARCPAIIGRACRVPSPVHDHPQTCQWRARPIFPVVRSTSATVEIIESLLIMPAPTL